MYYTLGKLSPKLNAWRPAVAGEVGVVPEFASEAGHHRCSQMDAEVGQGTGHAVRVAVSNYSGIMSITLSLLPPLVGSRRLCSGRPTWAQGGVD